MKINIELDLKKVAEKNIDSFIENDKNFQKSINKFMERFCSETENYFKKNSMECVVEWNL